MSEGDRLAEFVREGIDCVRVSHLQDSDTFARQVANAAKVTCAKPA